MGLAVTAGCLDAVGKVERSGVTQTIHRPAEPLFRGGLETKPEQEHFAALLQNGEEVAAVFYEHQFGRGDAWWEQGGFTLLLQTRISPDEPLRFDWGPPNTRVGWRSARFRMQLVPVDTSDPAWEFVDKLRDADDLILTSWWWFKTKRVPKPRTATVELLAPHDNTRATISTEDILDSVSASNNST